MKENVLRISAVLVLVAIVVAFNIVHASTSLGRPFGGTIVENKATEIQTTEQANYTCAVPGKTITIKTDLKSAPTTYFIPSAVSSKTHTTPQVGQRIKGFYSQSKSTITCKYRGYPPSQRTVELVPITLYGTSKK